MYSLSLMLVIPFASSVEGRFFTMSVFKQLTAYNFDLIPLSSHRETDIRYMCCDIDILLCWLI